MELSKYKKHFDDFAKKNLPINNKHIGNVYNAIHYSFFASNSKRIRPILIYSLSDSLNIDFQKVNNFAMAIECIHTYSLIHDDLPAMDNDDLRRGQISCHKKFDTATAILAGDALNTLAFEILTREIEGINPKLQLKQINILAECAGIDGMVGGQDTDLNCEKNKIDIDLNTLRKLHIKKTAKLIKACLNGAYIMSDDFDENKNNLLSKVSLSLGLFYQIQDDILDITQTSTVLGKPSSSDIDKQKSTYVSLMSLSGAKKEADIQINLVNNNLVDFFGSKKIYQNTNLAKVIEQISKRKY